MRTYQLLVLRVMVDPDSDSVEREVCGSMQVVDKGLRYSFTNWQELRSLLEEEMKAYREKQQLAEGRMLK